MAFENTLISLLVVKTKMANLAKNVIPINSSVFLYLKTSKITWPRVLYFLFTRKHYHEKSPRNSSAEDSFNTSHKNLYFQMLE